MTNSENTKMKVLVVDDEEVLRLLVGMTIESLGMEMIEAGNGKEALASIQKQNISFVITDMKMPGMNGMEFAQQVKKLSPTTEIIMVTGHLNAEIEKQAAEVGIYKVLGKPYDYEDMEKVIREASLRARKAA